MPYLERKIRRRQILFKSMAELAIEGDDGELVDVIGGHRFLYHFEEQPLPLAEILAQGTFRFEQKYGQLPSAVVMSRTAQPDSPQLSTELEIVMVDNLPACHFWFGPKPDYRQLSFPF